MANNYINYNRVVLDTIRPIIAKRSTDVPVIFAGTIGKFGAELRKVNVQSGTLDCTTFTLDLYNCKKAVDYALQLAGCDNIAYRGEKGDSIRLTAWNHDAVYVSELKPYQQIVGAGIMRVGEDKEGNKRTEIIVSAVARLANKDQTPDQNGRYPKVVLDNLAVIRPNGDIPVFFAGTRGRYDPFIRDANTQKGPMKVANVQVDFYNQKSNVDYLLNLCPIQRVAYNSEKSASLRVSAFRFDAEYIQTLEAGDNIIGGGVLRVAHSDKRGDSMEISASSIIRLFERKNSAPAQAQAAPTQAPVYQAAYGQQTAMQTATPEDNTGEPFIYTGDYYG